ncbi:MAG TPA: sulfotransferase [Cyanobacteria bacterium UBA12227]|nr:sulfotransferase [Cyanobacteria bacterium UBA12227]HAX89500.1 sulfotransferase [Cyanobacteria bacterium UBA11370]HBY81618.1 sulfotransferase [Cyanobacteria bacterium UBA11148]
MKFVVKQRLFLVGCPRSGTTLLQSLLAAHPQIVSFPESKFFQYLVPTYEPRRLASRIIASRQLKPRLEEFFKNEIGRPELIKYLPKFPLMREHTRKFIKILDSLAQEQGKSIWLEKTPEHIQHIDYIEKFVPRVRFIHILRNSLDTVASMYEVTRKYPSKYWREGWSIDFCLERWISAAEITRQHLHKSNHILVRYEQLVENPQSELEKLCQFIGIEFDKKMLQDYRIAAKQVSLEIEPWKAAVSEAIYKAKSQKFYEVFDESQQRYIVERLSEVNLDDLNS